MSDEVSLIVFGLCLTPTLSDGVGAHTLRGAVHFIFCFYIVPLCFNVGTVLCEICSFNVRMYCLGCGTRSGTFFIPCHWFCM